MTLSIASSKKSGDWYVWNHNCHPKYGTFVWRDGMVFATCVHCHKRDKVVGAAALPGGNRSNRPDTGVLHSLQLQDIDRDRDRKLYDYLVYRGLTDREIELYTQTSPHYPHSVAFPIEEDGEMVGVQMRDIHAGTLYRHKYLSFGYSRDNLWGLDRVQKDRPVFICEGIFDALYFECGVALLHADPTDIQIIKVLERLPNEIILCPQRDSNWSEDQWKKFNRWIPIATNILPKSCKDWGDVKAGRGEQL